MAYSDYQELIHLARENFIAGKYSSAEPLLKQVIAANLKEPEAYQMLATIFYEQGKFNRAIKTFQRALEIDPNYTDASIGLSIILNDLGRYNEGKDVFNKAQELLEQKKSKMDPYIKERLAKKHIEIASLYFQYLAFEEAIEQYKKAIKLSTKTENLIVKVADANLKLDQADVAIRELKTYLQKHPHALKARMKLGLIFYHANRMIEAVEHWDYILETEPHNTDVKSYIQMAQSSGVSDLGV